MSLHPRRYALIGATLALAAVTTSAAFAATQQTYTQKFTGKRPGHSTGMIFNATSRDPSQPGGTPAPVKNVTLTFPSGTRINSGAVPKCAKAPACPAKSKVGSGSATVIVANSVPLSLTDVSIYNVRGGMALVVNAPGMPPLVLTPRLSGLNLILGVPQLALPNPGGIGTLPAVLSSLSISVKQIGTGKKAYVTTPRTCPKGGWTFRGKFDYYDGTTRSLISRSACVKH